MFNSLVVAVTPSSLFSSVVLTVAPSNIANSVVVKLFIVPVVAIFCDPKFGSTFVPSIAAVALTSTLTIVPSFILAEVILPSSINSSVKG